MAIYTKQGQKIVNESISIDGECWMGKEVVKIRARTEGDTVEQYFWKSDLRADNDREIRDVIKANTKK